jgi:cytochrome d ubiquinol oxidase subunit I
VAWSLIAFIIAYFIIFTAGTVYLLRLMAAPPHHDEQGPASDVPIRAAGITPAIRATAAGSAS